MLANAGAIGASVRICPDLPPDTMVVGGRVFRVSTMEEVTGTERERILRWLARSSELVE